MMKHQRAAQSGFTLLEVLIALTLMAVLSLLSWRALDSTARSSEHLEASADDTMALLRVLGQVESDLSQHAGSGVLPAPPPQHLSSALAPVLPPSIRWEAPRLSILRAAHNGAWQEVVWEHAGDRLIRAAGAPALALPLPAAQNGEVMLTGVRSVTLRAWLPGQGWVQSVAGSAPPPSAGLEIAIVRHHDGRDEAYRKIVTLP